MPSRQNPSNFYVFITSENLFPSSLIVPIDFTKEHAKQILLTVSDNKTWPMHWMTSDKGQLQLQKGWFEFAEHYRLKIGHLLLFTYQGDFTFNVGICDRTSCEINYFPRGIDQSSGLSASATPLCWKPNNFYVYITYVSLYPSSLRMPIEFSSEHGEDILSTNVSLIVSNGETWRMDWTISGNGQLWLQKGWPEFEEHYDLKIGHLLFFSHQGSSTFHVRIFDGSNFEINYLPQEIDQSVHMADTDALHTPTKFQDNEGNPSVAPEQTLDNPFYSVTVPASYFLSVGVGLYMPASFCRRHLTTKVKSVDCFLCISDGRIWGPVKCTDYGKYGKLSGENLKKFSDENQLGVGDVCRFELINVTEKVLEVGIIRA